MRILLRIIAISTLILSACKPSTTSENEPAAKAFEPKLQLFSSYDRGNNLIDALYNEALEKSSTLKALEQTYEATRQLQTDSCEAFEHYDANSQAYYHDALQRCATIKDSALKVQLETAIKNSQSHYTKSISAQLVHYQQIQDLQTALYEQHTALKLLVSLPALHTYQSTQLPSTKRLQSVIKHQEQTLEKIKNETKTH